ncbi:MAG: precorrin-2 dehydrogenase/sirohydrochlorin ferrochelatase [Sulfurimonas sp.]|jgi:precorrin-2 dehydrogenase/sirohydrochlorin ferrochelatase
MLSKLRKRLMAYFPAFIKLDNKKILIIGGGNIASQKLSHLLDFTKNISVIAPDICEDMAKAIEDNSLVCQKRAYIVGDIKDFAIVVMAIDNIELQADIYTESKQYKCLCNSVDSTQYCDFIFPSYVKKDDLTIAISTSGASPAMAKHLKLYLQNLIPAGISEFLAEMKDLRRTLPKGRERMKMLDKKAQDYIKSWSNK